MKHLCHAVDCEVPVAPKLLFCLRHWRMLQSPLQRAVWQCYRKGQEIDKRPSARYLVIQALAVTFVASREGTMDADDACTLVLKRMEALDARLTDEDHIYLTQLAKRVTKELQG